jgi:hypothetical protein
MTPTIAEIYLRSPDPASFRAAVQSLDGRFRFGSEDMITLGRAYFDRHPDRPADRDLEAVRLGYALVRIVVGEVLVRGLGPELKTFFRAVFQDAASAGARTDEQTARDPAALRRGLASVSAAFEEVKAEIDLIPKGLIKERFVGGISHLSNVLFLVKMKAALQ